jgi:hypothetical protein
VRGGVAVVVPGAGGASVREHADGPGVALTCTIRSCAVETVGFEGALTPTGAWCENAWLTTAMLVAGSERLSSSSRSGPASSPRANHPDGTADAAPAAIPFAQ